MADLQQIFAMQKKYIFFLLAICALGWGFTPYQTIFAGLALGSFFGLYNFWLLIRKMGKFDKAMDEGKKASLGTAMRFYIRNCSCSCSHFVTRILSSHCYCYRTNDSVCTTFSRKNRIWVETPIIACEREVNETWVTRIRFGQIRFSV